MTPNDKLYKILSKLKAYMSTPEECIQEIQDLIIWYPEFTPEAEDDFRKWFTEDNPDIK